MNVIDRITEIAESRGLSYAALAAIVGVEQGKEPTEEQVAKFADILKTTKDELVKDPELFELQGVEVFRAGTWNGDKYTEQDLEDMVSAFGAVGYRPPLKLGHREESGAPAYGWVKSLRRDGDKLVADFMDLPKKVYEAIKERRFDSVSSEIFWNIKRGARTFRRALKAVALLGAEIPAVAGLKPLRELFSLPHGAAVHAYTLKSEDFDMSNATVEQLQKDLKAAQDTIKELQAKSGNEEQVKQLQAQLDGMKAQAKAARIKEAVAACKVPAFRPALEALFTAAGDVAEDKTYTLKVADKEEKVTAFAALESLRDQINAQAGKLFKELAGQDAADLPESHDNVTAEVDRKTKEYMDKHPDVKDYAVAMKLVLRDPTNKELAAKYAAA